MSLLDTLRKGLGFLMMSMGVSAPLKKKARPVVKPGPKVDPGR
jgi:hypothetical protein